MTMAAMHVDATQLNLRREPIVRSDTLIASLPFGHAVEVVGDAQVAGWKSVRTQIDGATVSGFVAGARLREPVSARKEALIAEAAAQWERFDRGSGPENVNPFAGFVGEMWQALGIDFDGRDRNQPWSAAFISFVARRAEYDGFKFAAAHARYIHDSIVKRQAGEDSPFWGFRLNEHAPLLGDLVCRNRSGGRITFAQAAEDDGFISHCDIVIQVGTGFVLVVGGNVGDSVRIRQCETDDQGRIVGPSTVFAILRNNL
jgi:hypothetical protein